MSSLSKAWKRVTLLAGMVGVFVLALPMHAFATVDSTAVTTVSGAASDLKDTLLAVFSAVLPFAIAIIGLVVGYAWAKSMIGARKKRPT